MLMRKHLKVFIVSMMTTVSGAVIGWVIFPNVLKIMLKKEMSLAKKNDVRQMWEKIPFALEFKVVFFNYTNPDEIEKGGIPIVKEIGPYFFEEWKEKVDLVDNDEDDTVSYRRLDTFIFNKEKSGAGLTGEEMITLPHFLILSLLNVVVKDKPAMLSMTGKAINGIFDNPTSVFTKYNVLDLLFRGVHIDCAKTEFAPKAVCTAMKKEGGNNFIIEPNNQYKFSLFGKRNGTPEDEVWVVKRGIRNVLDVGKVVSIGGNLQMKTWRDQCNEFQGTDATIFPPFFTEFIKMESYSSDLCRPFKPNYQKKTSYKGIHTLRYVTTIGDLQNDPELNCMCDAADDCPPKGIMSLMKCKNAPILASMPHFLDGDPELLENIKGLNPDPNEHGIEIDLEPLSGTPMLVKQRVQLNIKLVKAELELSNKLPNSIAPIIWVEEGLALNKTFVKMLKHQLFLPKRFIGVLKWLMIASGSLGVLFSSIYHLKDRIMRFAITEGEDMKVQPAAEDENQEKSISVIGQAQEPAKVTM